MTPQASAKISVPRTTGFRAPSRLISTDSATFCPEIITALFASLPLRLTIAVTVTIACLQAIPSHAAAALHPVASAASFELHPDLELTLFAQEPDVVDPVWLSFDENGAAYVVEMRDYPYGFGPDRRPGGTLRRLVDSDGDGRADRSTLFAENLSFPTSVMPWNEGVLVVASPEILFLRDTDGDGKADVREVLLKGLQLGVTDSNANGLRWGLDNWIHVVNGGNGGLLVAPKAGSESVRLGDRDFRFRPATGAIELTAHTGGGFGLVFDDWGNSFTPYNIDHIRQRVADVDAFTRFPGLPAVETTHTISDHGDMARIFSISTAVTRPNHPEQAGHFSSAGAMGYLGHRGWPGDLPGSVFVCDVVGNIVHRDLLKPNGPILTASRPPAEQTREFFASRDPSFRPTGIELGPDGALYLLDMQRDVIEHPDYIPKRLLDTLDLRAGSDRGRIYRIAPKGWTRTRELPGSLRGPALADSLASSNQWTRVTAQRLIVSRQDRSTVPTLERLLTSSDPVARLHALSTLDGLGSLSEPSLLKALGDSHPDLRANAVAMAQDRPVKSQALLDAVVRRVSDDAPRVRFSALLALGSFRESYPLPPILATLRRDAAHPWMRRAALAALRPGNEATALSQFLPVVSSNPEELNTLLELADLVGARITQGDSARLTEVIVRGLSTGSPPASIPLQTAFLDGLFNGLKRSGSQPALLEPGVAALHGVVNAGSTPLLAAAWRVARLCRVPDAPSQTAALAAAARTARDSGIPLARRIEALRLVDLAAFQEAGPVVFALLDGREPSALQQAALELLREHKEPEIGDGLVRSWSSLSPALRPAVVNLLVYRHAFHGALLTALESGTVQIGEMNLDLEHRRQLLRRATPEIRSRAAKLMSDEEYSNRKAAVDQWLARLPATGDPARGRPVFERICAQCHRSGSLGFTVGPDLTGIRHRSVEDLLSNILDPNMAMNPAYVAFTADLLDGESETGILLSETPETITLVQAAERKVSIPRSKLKQLKSGGRSLMPEGLEAGLTPANLRDLIAFLQDPGPAQGAVGGAQ